MRPGQRLGRLFIVVGTKPVKVPVEFYKVEGQAGMGGRLNRISLLGVPHPQRVDKRAQVKLGGTEMGIPQQDDDCVMSGGTKRLGQRPGHVRQPSNLIASRFSPTAEAGEGTLYNYNSDCSEIYSVCSESSKPFRKTNGLPSDPLVPGGRCTASVAFHGRSEPMVPVSASVHRG